jgi:class 3 adenylate cyclase
VRVHRSFAFVDILGFTALTEHEGDERAVEVLAAFRRLLRDICGRRGVRIAKWLGDGAMLVGVETQPLLATILELHYVVGAVPARRRRPPSAPASPRATSF